MPENPSRISWVVAPAFGDGALILRHVAPDPSFACTPRRGAPLSNAAETLCPFHPRSKALPMSDLASVACRQ